ncbi:MAG: hypothetical protein QOI61_657 [Actinomycetota bacterium]
MKRVRLIALVALVPVLLAGCSVSPGDKVRVTMKEWSINVTPAQATSGRVRFEIDSDGERTHNFALILAKDIADVPKTPQGAIDLVASRPIDEIDAFEPGHYIATTPNLLAGDYLMVCTLVTDGVPHFAQGMVAKFHVNERAKKST